MSVHISSTASAMLTSGDVKTYTECKLYNHNDTYLTDLSVVNASWNQSRNFGVSVLNITILNSGGRHNLGEAYEIKKDYILVLIEGYDTTTASDKLPKFKGYIKDITFNASAELATISLTVYDELIITQRSDMDKLFVADTTKITREVLVPYVENQITTVMSNPSGKFVRLVHSRDNLRLDEIVKMGYFYVNRKKFHINQVNLNHDGSTIKGIFLSGAVNGTLTAGDSIQNEHGTYFGKILTGLSATYYTGEHYVKVSGTGNWGHGDKFYKVGNSSIYFYAKSFYEVQSVVFQSQLVSIASAGVLANDIIHDGWVSAFRSTHPNWADFKVHSLNATKYGAIDEDAGDIYNGYEVNHERGLIRFNEPKLVDESDIMATYYYCPTGLYLEDVLEELLVTDDQLSINIIKNGNFTQGTTNWAQMASGAVTSDFIIGAKEGIDIVTLNTLTANEWIGISQSNINLLSGYTYTVSVNVYTTKAISGVFKMKLGNQASGMYSINVGSIGQTMTNISYTYTPSTAITNTKLLIYLSGCDAGDIWHLNDVKVAYNPSKVNCLTTNHLYTTVSVENGTAATYNMEKNLNFTTLPRYTNLTDRIRNTSTSVKVLSTTGFPTQGHLLIDNEYIIYTGKTASSFTGITRAQISSVQNDHEIGVRAWQVISASKVWYMEYNNIIPKSSNSTASTYDEVNGINVGSAGSFTISNSIGATATFKEFFYRQGILVLSGVGVASAVSLSTNLNYFFSQLQSTDIETNKILIDYRKVNTRYDAITEIRSLIAPNYCINAVVRKNGSNYKTYIKGRYLTQKTIADYNLSFINSINYQTPNSTYNRVKMFGKLANPTNLMYGRKTVIHPANDLHNEYVKGIEYTYSGNDGTWAIFSVDAERRFNYNNTPENYFRCNVNIYTSRNSVSRSVSNGRFEGNDYYIVKLAWYEQSNPYARVYNQVAGVRIRGYYDEYRLDSYTELPAPQVYEATFYNIYYVNYSNALQTFEVGNTFNDGSGKIKYVKTLDTQAPYDAYIYVEHVSGKTPYSNAASVTVNTGYTGTLYLVEVEGFTDQYNYNPNSSTEFRIAGYYDMQYNTAQGTTTFTLPTLVNKNDYVLYINNYPYNANNVTWIERVEELGNVENYRNHNWCASYLLWSICIDWRNDAFYRRSITANTNAYFNKTLADAQNNGFGENPANASNWIVDTTRGFTMSHGGLRFEKHNGDGSVTDLLTLFMDNQAGYNHSINDDYGSIFDQVKRGGYMAFKRNSGQDYNNLPIPSKMVKEATHIRYHSKYPYAIEWEFFNDSIRIKKSILDGMALDPNKMNLKIDGNFMVHLPTEYISTDTRPIIQRLRDFTGIGREEQVGLISRFPIQELPLFVVDLGEIKSIKYIDIQAGFLYKPSSYNDTGKYDNKFKIKLQYSTINKPFKYLDDSEFSSITEDTNNLEATSGEIITVDESKLGERFEARFLKFYVSATDIAITEGTDKKEINWYGASIAGIAIYESDIIVSEKYTNSGIINMFKDTNVYEQLYTQKLLDTYTQYKLDEFQKEPTLVNVSSPWSPHIEVGMTVNLTDSENSINQNYFVESVSHGDTGTSISMAYYS